MREQGGGTLFSQVIDRPKLSVKVSPVAAAADGNEGKRRLSNGGSMYASYGAAGAKSMLGGGILPPPAQASMQQRLKGGSGGAMFAHGQRHSSAAELHDLSAVERLKELRARLEPLLKPKPAHPSHPLPPPSHPRPAPLEECISAPLPQWGLGKRARRSRFEGSKLNGAAATAKALPPRSADETVIPARSQGWFPSSPAYMESDGHSSKGVPAARNGIASRAVANSCISSRHGNNGGESAGLSHKREPSNTLRQRSDGSAEAPISNNCSKNGHMMGAAHHSRVSASALETAAAPASLHVKPRSELQTLEWPRFLIGLSRREKEDDFLIFKGTKLPQRPKKRPKVVERTLHYFTPGNSLCDLSRGRYDVREKKSAKKRARGLKAMESMESDSE